MLRFGLILLAGTALGVVSAAAAMWQMGIGGAVQVGPWVTPLDAGGPGRSNYLRATAALRATLALSRKEAIYFRTITDTAGDALVGNCTYRLHGTDLPARWWSITLYGADHYLIENPENRYSFASPNVAHDADGGFTIMVSPTKQTGNWLNTAHAGHLVLLTRLYESDKAGDPAGLKLPTIEKLGCL